MTFKEKAFNVVRDIPKGETLTYKQVAKRVGSPKAWRAIGNVLAKNYDSRIPCHRVVRSDNSIGGYNRGKEKKRSLLEQEAL